MGRGAQRAPRALDSLQRSTRWFEIHGSPDSYKAALAVGGHLRQLSVLVSFSVMGFERWHAERGPMDAAMRRYVDQIRIELGLGRLPDDRDSWVTAAPGA